MSYFIDAINIHPRSFSETNKKDKICREFIIKRELNFLYQMAKDISGDHDIFMASEKEISNVFNKPVGIVSTSKDGIVISMNNVVRELVGDIVGESLHKYIRCEKYPNCPKESFLCFCNKVNILLENIDIDNESLYIVRCNDGSFRKMAIYMINTGNGLEFVFYLLDRE